MSYKVLYSQAVIIIIGEDVCVQAATRPSYHSQQRKLCEAKLSKIFNACQPVILYLPYSISSVHIQISIAINQK